MVFNDRSTYYPSPVESLTRASLQLDKQRNQQLNKQSNSSSPSSTERMRHIRNIYSFTLKIHFSHDHDRDDDDDDDVVTDGDKSSHAYMDNFIK